MPSYVVALILLLLNDHVLKYVWPGFVTGKLSDFAGVFAFAAFFASALPRRAAWVCVATGTLFVWWKSPLSQPVVDALGVSRVVDWTDLAALVVLPFAYRVAVRRPIVWKPAIVCVSFFAFAATSVAHTTVYIEENDSLRRIETRMPVEDALKTLERCGFEPAIYHGSLFLHYESEVLSPRKDLSAVGTLVTEADGVVLSFQLIRVMRPSGTIDERKVCDELASKIARCAIPPSPVK